MIDTTLKPVIKNDKLATQVFEKLRGAIFVGEFQPGEPLREMHLAQLLHVSQATVREALVQLERLGLVQRVSNKGTTVTKLSKKDIQDRYSVRLVLEQKAFVEAAERMTDDSFAELGGHLENITNAVNRNAYFEAAHADLQFHRYVWEQADNKILYEMLDHLVVPLFAFVSIVRRSNLDNLQEHNDPHERLVAALKSRDHQIIAEALRGHFTDCEATVRARI